MNQTKKLIVGIACLILVLMFLSSGLQAMEKPKPAEQEPLKATWLTSIEEAQKIAQKTNKDILIDFTGSDWCGWCIKLHEEVFGTEKWNQEIPKKYVLVVLDFPKNKELSKEQKEYNEKLGREYAINGYPTVILLDSAGRIYARTGYQKGGVDNYLTHLEELAKQKQTINDSLKQIKESVVDKRLGLMDAFLIQANKWGIGMAYMDMKEEIIDLDTDNKAGLKLKYALELVGENWTKKDQKKTEMCLKVVKELDAGKAKDLEIEIKMEGISNEYFTKKDWKGALTALEPLINEKPSNEVLQKLYYLRAMAFAQLRDEESFTVNMEKAIDSAPDSDFGKQLQQKYNNYKQKKQSK
jgi:thioredoxin-related protein